MGNTNILLVEDSEGDILLIEEIISKTEGVRLKVITDGEIALNYFENNPMAPNLILLDINLPKINGLQLLKSIRNIDNFKDTPVIVLTTSSNENEKREAIAYKANAFITKSFDPYEFEITINEILNNWL